jgi:hypothetical protein
MKLLITLSNADLAAKGVDPVKTQVQVQCGCCGGKSYVKTIEGCFHPGAAADDIAFDVVLPAPWSGLTISRTHFPFKRATGLTCPLPLWADRPLKGMVESLARLCL